MSEKRKAYMAKWREENRAKVNAQSLEWVSRQKDKDQEGFLARMNERAQKYRLQRLEEYRRREREASKKRRDKDRAKYNAIQREYRRNNPEKFRAYYEKKKAQPDYFQREKNKWLKKLYGLDIEKYEAMVKSQGGKCALCKTIPKTSLAVDHCHNGGHVRELLCSGCNLLLGRLEKGLERNLEFLELVAEYLKKHSKH